MYVAISVLLMLDSSNSQSYLVEEEDVVDEVGDGGLSSL
jgi:hypothetical protein